MMAMKAGLLTPDERLEVEEKAEKYKEDQQIRLQRKEEALKTTVGRGLLYITMSLIKFRQDHMYTWSICSQQFGLQLLSRHQSELLQSDEC